MSFDNKKKSCVFCHAYLFEEDDVVYCPVCGAPHHRECYNKINRCALEEFHGTENQYDKLKAAEPKEEKNSEETKEADSSEEQYKSPFGGFAPIDFLGGVKGDTLIDEGVTATDAAKFVFSNTIRYIPKFTKLNPNNKVSWNFMAFFFPGSWMLSRKMYKIGILSCALEFLAVLLSIPFQTAMDAIYANNTAITSETATKLYEEMLKIDPLIMLAAFVASMGWMAFKILMGLFGDWIYKKHVVKSVREINSDSEDKDYDFRKRGGVNIFMFFIGIMAAQYLPVIIINIIQGGLL